MSAQTRIEWLAKFWSMQSNSGLAITQCSGVSLTFPLDVIFQKEQPTNTDLAAASYPCTIKEMAVTLSDMFTTELKLISNADHNGLKWVYCYSN